MSRSKFFVTLAVLTQSACGGGEPTTSSGSEGGAGGQAGREAAGSGPAGASSGGAGSPTGSGGVPATGGMPGNGGRTGPGGGSAAGGAAGGHGGAMAAGGAETGGRAGSGGRGGAAGGRTGTGGRGGALSMGGAPGLGGQSGAGGLGPEAPGGRVSGYGTVLISANSKSEITRLRTDLLVPPGPVASGTLFLWPGLQPGGANFDPINNGVLQPVLTWGSSCAPGKQPRSYSTWWISGQYVNTFGKEPGYTGCQGGPVMPVAVGDTLAIDMSLSGTTWTQTVTDVQTSQSVSYSIDMKGQAQNDAYFVIEGYSSKPVSQVVFTNTVITFAASDSADCKLAMRGQTDYVSVPAASSDGRSCSIQEIILRAQGIQ